MEITKELFAIPRGENYLLYAPLEGAVLEVQPGVLSFLKGLQSGENPQDKNPKLYEHLRKNRIIVDKQGALLGKCESGGEYLPTSVTLLPTYNCNLRCIYCYARGGEEIGKVMNPEIARASIDFIVNNALKTKQNKISMGFHGGGEPLLPCNMDLVQFSVEYMKDQAKRNDLDYRVSSASNGVFNDHIFNWVIENLTHLGLSLDGPEDIQNAQRPMAGNKPSYQRVMETLKRFEELPEEIKKRFGYSIRSTITVQSVTRMPEILEFFASISSNKSFHLEPLFECGRCSTSRASSPNPESFLENMIKASKVAEKLGKEIYYSGSTIEKISETFCGACGNNFFVTPEGYVITCLEACRPEEKPAEVFLIGRYNPESKKFDFNEDKRKVLLKRKVSNIDYCADCFAKYNCAGDCPAKVWEQSGDLNNPANNWRCSINQGLLAHNLATRLNKEKERSSKIEQKTETTKAC